MRKFLLPILAIILLQGACTNEFEINAPWKSIPVAYAILSPTDTAHYVRVEKAFLDTETENSLTVAQNPDSLYFEEDEIAVYVEHVGSGNRVLLERVNGTLEGFVRDSGIFAQDPNYLYKFKPEDMLLEEQETYRLILERADGSQTATAETTIPGRFAITTPNPLDIPPKITFQPDETAGVQWRTDVNGLFFNFTFSIRYREENSDGTVHRRDTIEWLALKNVKRRDNPSGAGGELYSGVADASGNAFFDLLDEEIPTVKIVDAFSGDTITPFRYFDGVDITMEGGGLVIQDFLLTQQANSGITGAEIFPTYTNLEPEGVGFGIFTGKNTFRMINIRVSDLTIEKLNEDPRTADLNFQ